MKRNPIRALSLSVLRLRNFRATLCTRMFITMALQAQAVVVGWQVYSLTKDPFLLGLTGLTEAVPALFCALFAGHVVDISKPFTVYRLTLFALALNTFVFLLIGGGLVEAPGGSILPWIFGGVFFSGVARSFVAPSAFSLVPKIVSHAEMPAASAWMSSGFQIATITGPAVAGLIYGGYGPRGAWIIPAFLMTMAFLVLNTMRLPPHMPAGARNESAVKSIAAGWHFIFRHPILLSVMSLDMFAVLFGGAVAMLPAYADRILHVGAEGLGMLRAAPAVGAVAMSLAIAFNPLKVISARRLLVSVACFGLCMIGFGFSTSFGLSLGFLLLSGVFDSVSMVMRGTIMQLSTPDAMRGRVSAINSMFIISSNELGSFESGLAARYLGLVPSVVFGGVGTLAVVGAIAFLSPQFRRTRIDVQDLRKTAG